MHLKTFKGRKAALTKLGAAIALACLPVAGFAGIPTVDILGNVINQQGYTMTGEGIRNQTEATINAMDYTTKALAKVIIEAENNSVKTQKTLETQEEFSPEVSKPMGACTTYKSAGARGTGHTSRAELSKEIAKITHRENMRTANLSAGEPRRAYIHGEAIRELENMEATDTVTAFEQAPFEEEDYGAVLQAVTFATNPLPQPVPTQEELDTILENGDPADKSSYARVLVHNDRLKRMQQVLINQKEGDLKQYDSESIEYLLRTMPMTKKDRELLSGKISKNQIDEVMATYRTRSPEWVRRVHTSSTRNLRNDSALMQAEQLRLLWSIDKSINTLITIAAQAEANRLNQAGATEH